MGKKTTKFINDIDSHQTACKKAMEEFILCSERYKELEVRLDKARERMVRRFSEVGSQSKSNDRTTINQALANDGEYVQAQKEYEDLHRESTGTLLKRSQAHNEIRSCIETIDGALQVFETYINKKAKSKNPFKSKKSIPAAKDYIEASKAFVENSREFFKSIGGSV
jgi:hypothetical protein